MVPAGRIALIFDMDNTVIGSRIDFPGIRRRVIALLHAAGATDDPAEELITRPIAELVACGAAFDRAHDTSLTPRLWQVIEAHEEEGLSGAPALDGAPDVLGGLKERGYRMAVLTNNGREQALRALTSVGLSDLVETIVARHDVPALKPAADGIREAVRRLGGDVELVYMIGDSWIDGAAAAAAGARFIAYRRTAEELQSRGIRPWRVVMHLSELLTLDLSS
jgi:phosphoglycolate phosphatase